MKVRINGETREFNEGATVTEMLRCLGLERAAAGVAVAVNDTVVPRCDWKTAPLREGDTVELVHAVQGG